MNNDMIDFDIEFLSQKLSDNPQSPLFARLADLYMQKEQTVEALSLCKEGLEFFPDYYAGYIVLGKAHLSLKEYSKARAAFEKAKVYSPFNRSVPALLQSIPGAPDESARTTDENYFSPQTPGQPENVSHHKQNQDVPSVEMISDEELNYTKPAEQAFDRSISGTSSDPFASPTQKKFSTFDEYISQNKDRIGELPLMTLDEYLSLSDPSSLGMDEQKQVPTGQAAPKGSIQSVSQDTVTKHDHLQSEVYPDETKNTEIQETVVEPEQSTHDEKNEQILDDPMFVEQQELTTESERNVFEETSVSQTGSLEEVPTISEENSVETEQPVEQDRIEQMVTEQDISDQQEIPSDLATPVFEESSETEELFVETEEVQTEESAVESELAAVETEAVEQIEFTEAIEEEAPLQPEAISETGEEQEIVAEEGAQEIQEFVAESEQAAEQGEVEEVMLEPEIQEQQEIVTDQEESTDSAEVLTEQTADEPEIVFSSSEQEQHFVEETQEETVQEVPEQQETNIDELAERLRHVERIKPPEQSRQVESAPEATQPAEESESDMVTPTLAEIYASQGEYSAAIQAYEFLLFTQPGKSAEFQLRIKELQKLKMEKDGTI